MDATQDTWRCVRCSRTAHLILIPEYPFRYQKVFQLLKERLGESGISRAHVNGLATLSFVVAEGARAEDGEMVTIDDRHDSFVMCGWVVSARSRRRIASETPYESRAVYVGAPATWWAHQVG